MKVKVTVFDGEEVLGTTWLNNCSENQETECTLCKEALGWSFPLCDAHLEKKLKLAVRESPVHGLGLFTTAARLKNEPLCPLGGEVRTEAQLNNLYSFARDPECVAPYCVTVGKKRVDAFRLRYAWVYVNHAHEVERRNCHFKKDGVYASRDLTAGEELLLDYGAEYKFQCALTFKYDVFSSKEHSPGSAESAASKKVSFAHDG